MSLLIWRFKWVGIIAGYDEKKVKDKAGLAKWFGKCCLSLAILSITWSILCFYSEPLGFQQAILLGILFTFTIMFGTIITLSGMSKYYNF
jgi:uncharacterized membrane protein YiaA